jgi:hypothetical protein
VLLFIMVVYNAGKERTFVSICSALYLSNFVALVKSSYLVRRQIYVVYFTLKKNRSEPLKQPKPSV